MITSLDVENSFNNMKDPSTIKTLSEVGVEENILNLQKIYCKHANW